MRARWVKRVSPSFLRLWPLRNRSRFRFCSLNSLKKLHLSNVTEPIRISKILAQRGIASRSEADRMIEKGWVAVNGRVAIPGDRALPSDEITLSPEAHAQLDDTLTVIMNKPRGCTSAADEFGGAPAMTLLTTQNYFSTASSAPDASQPPRLPGSGLRVAGRLSTREMGLVVFTTDTALARRLAATDVEEIWRIDFRE